MDVWFRFDAPGGFLVHSFAGDDPLGCRDYVRERLQLPDWRSVAPPRRPVRPTTEVNAQRATHPVHATQQARIAGALGIWGSAVDPHGTIAEAYVRSRSLGLDAGLTGTIRFHGSLSFDGRRVAGMVALMRDIRTNEPTGVHRTFFDDAGRKIGRKMLGRAKGAAIKLDAREDVTLGLHLGEGIETCLAARQLGYRPVWALGSASSIAAFPALAGIEAITVFAENDDASTRAAETCCERYENAGCEAWIVEPPSGDLNDFIRRAA